MRSLLRPLFFTLVGCMALPFAVRGQQPFTSETYGFSIQFPQGWITKSSIVEHTVVKARNPVQDFICYLSIAVYPDTSGIGSRINKASAYNAYALVKPVFGLENTTLTKYGDATIAGMAMHWMSISFTVLGRSSRCKIYFFGRGGQIYRFTYCNDGTQTQYDQSLELFEQSMSTLQFKN